MFPRRVFVRSAVHVHAGSLPVVLKSSPVGSSLKIIARAHHCHAMKRAPRDTGPDENAALGPNDDGPWLNLFKDAVWLHFISLIYIFNLQ